jgi:hypothetical protein
MIPPRYKAISAFHEGLAVVHQEGESQSKYIDHSGKTVAGPFNLAWEFSEGLARVHLPDGRSAFIDREGKVQCTLDKQVSWVEPFADGMAKATTLTEPGRVEKIGYIDRSGRFAIPPVYEAGSSFRNGLALVYSCNQSGYVGKNGEAVWGIKPRSRVAQAQATPPAAALTAERIAKIAGHPGPLILEVSPVSGACDGFGKKLWSLAVKSTDGTFPAFTINLLEGGTFLSDEMVGNLKGLQEKLRGFGDTSNSFIRPIGPAKKPIGYASVPGVGPGGSLTVASVFSVDQQYEVQVMLGQGGRDRPLKDPVEWTSKVALDVLSALFETGK